MKERASALVLCGGQSLRMGRPKALLPWQGRTLLAHSVDRLRAIVDEVVVVSGGLFDLPAIDAPVVNDPEPHLGPLAGLSTGLAQIRHRCAFVTATDAPHLDADVITALFRHQRGERAAVALAEGRVQPLIAVYPKSAQGMARRLLEQGERRPLTLLEGIGFDTLPISDQKCEQMRGLNTPDDYLAAVRADDPEARVRVELLGSARRSLGRASFDAEVGTLAEILEPATRALELFDGDSISRHFLVSIDARHFARSAGAPVGPGERVFVMDAAVGG